MADLAEFAKANPRRVGVPCWACTIPEAAEVNAAKRNRAASTAQMVAWLSKEKGHGDEARESRLDNHFQKRHHERWPDGRTA